MQQTWLMSGLGGDERLYSRMYLDGFPDSFRFLNWNDFNGCESIAGFTRRAIKLGIGKHDNIIGSSFGGMLAQWISAVLDIETIVLLGSAQHPCEINRLALQGGNWFRSADPYLMQELSRPLQLFYPKRIEVRMFVDAPVEVMLGMRKALLSWRHVYPSSANVYRLHGLFDPLIPFRSNQKYDRLCKAAHVVALESPVSCRNFVDSCL